MGEDKEQYEKPAIIIECDIVTSAGPSPIDVNPLDNILLSDSLGLGSPLE